MQLAIEKWMIQISQKKCYWWNWCWANLLFLPCACLYVHSADLLLLCSKSIEIRNEQECTLHRRHLQNKKFQFHMRLYRYEFQRMKLFSWNAKLYGIYLSIKYMRLLKKKNKIKIKSISKLMKKKKLNSTKCAVNHTHTHKLLRKIIRKFFLL